MSPHYYYQKEKKESDQFLQELLRRTAWASASYCPRCGAKAPYHSDNCGPWAVGKTSELTTNLTTDRV